MVFGEYKTLTANDHDFSKDVLCNVYKACYVKGGENPGKIVLKNISLNKDAVSGRTSCISIVDIHNSDCPASHPLLVYGNDYSGCVPIPNLSGGVSQLNRRGCCRNTQQSLVCPSIGNLTKPSDLHRVYEIVKADCNNIIVNCVYPDDIIKTEADANKLVDYYNKDNISRSDMARVMGKWCGTRTDGICGNWGSPSSASDNSSGASTNSGSGFTLSTPLIITIVAVSVFIFLLFLFLMLR